MWWARSDMPVPLTQPPYMPYNRPKEAGGMVPNYPVLDNHVQTALFRELRFSWGIGDEDSPARDWVNQQGNQTDYVSDWAYFGDVYSIQATVRPGWYIAPDVLATLVDDRGVPFG